LNIINLALMALCLNICRSRWRDVQDAYLMPLHTTMIYNTSKRREHDVAPLRILVIEID